jgi:(E)-4-hydroxy-3-methyl-but-2-enyl pyrophosphate reductase
MSTVVLAEEAGFCFGVKRAVEIALNTKAKYNKVIYTLGPLIHNSDVVKYLVENDIFPIEYEDIETLNIGDIIIIRSHGISPEILEVLKKKKLNIVNATCPYVTNIQIKAKKYFDLGYGIIIVGDSTHPEVIGINGWCNNSAIISKNGFEIDKLPSKVCVLSQTTEKQENWEMVLNIIISKCKEIVAFNTICSATEIRQQSAEKLSTDSDLMIVIGGKDSSNTTKLYEICKKNCANTIHVENIGEIPLDILKSKTYKSIGITAGASTPDWIIEEAILKMNENNK